MTGERPRQLSLELPHRPAMSRADFLDGRANREAIALIDWWPDWPERPVLITGPAGSGATSTAVSPASTVATDSVGTGDSSHTRSTTRSTPTPLSPEAMSTGNASHARTSAASVFSRSATLGSSPAR